MFALSSEEFSMHRFLDSGSILLITTCRIQKQILTQGIGRLFKRSLTKATVLEILRP